MSSTPTRSKETLVCFSHPFILDSVGRELPEGEYRIVTEEEAIDGLSFVAYRRVATSIAVPLTWQKPISPRADRFASVEMVRITPAELARALERDGAKPL